MLAKSDNRYDEKIDWERPATWDATPLTEQSVSKNSSLLADPNLLAEQLQEVEENQVSRLFKTTLKKDKAGKDQTGLDLLNLNFKIAYEGPDKEGASKLMHAIYKVIFKPTYNPDEDKKLEYKELKEMSHYCVRYEDLASDIWSEIIVKNKDIVSMGQAFLGVMTQFTDPEILLKFMIKIDSFNSFLLAKHRSGKTNFEAVILPRLETDKLVEVVNLFDANMLTETLKFLLTSVAARGGDVSIYLQLWKIITDPKHKQSSVQLRKIFMNNISSKLTIPLSKNAREFTAMLMTFYAPWLYKNVDVLLQLHLDENTMKIFIGYWQSLVKTDNLVAKKYLACKLFRQAGTHTSVLKVLIEQEPSFKEFLLSDEFKESAPHPTRESDHADAMFPIHYLNLLPENTYNKRPYLQLHIAICLRRDLPKLDTNKEGWQKECLKFFETINNHIQDNDAELKTLFLRTYNEYFMEFSDKMPLALAMACDPALTQFLMAYAYYVPRPQSVEETYKYYSILVKMCLLADPISPACYDAARIEAYNPSAKDTLIGQLNKENRQPVNGMDTKPLFGTYFTYLENTYNKAAKHVISSRARTHMDNIKRRENIREGVVYLPNAIGEFFSIIEPTAPLKPSEERDEHWNSKCPADESGRAPSISSTGNAQSKSNLIGKLFSKNASTAPSSSSKAQTTVDEPNSKCSADETYPAPPTSSIRNVFTRFGGLSLKLNHNKNGHHNLGIKFFSNTGSNPSHVQSQIAAEDEHNSKPSALVGSELSASADENNQDQLISPEESVVATPVDASVPAEEGVVIAIAVAATDAVTATDNQYNAKMGC